MTVESCHVAVKNLHIGFETFDGFVDVVDVEELTIAKGESYGLVGESGAGKTVLALSLQGLLRSPPAVISAVEMRIAGNSILELNKRGLRALRGTEVSMIFQDPMSALDPVYTAGQQLRDVIRRRAGVKRGAAGSRAIDLARLVELPDPDTILEKYPHQLSGGQRQRVIIALALACETAFLIADEPTRNLDVTVQASILRTVHRLRKELGVSVLFIANNLALVGALCDRVGVLLKGRVVETGTVEDVVHAALHPYTLDLLHAVPRRGEALMDLKSGIEVVDPSISSCGHFSRCRMRGPHCQRTEVMPLTAVTATHAVACAGVMAESSPRGPGEIPVPTTELS